MFEQTSNYWDKFYHNYHLCLVNFILGAKTHSFTSTLRMPSLLKRCSEKRVVATISRKMPQLKLLRDRAHYIRTIPIKTIFIVKTLFFNFTSKQIWASLAVNYPILCLSLPNIKTGNAVHSAVRQKRRLFCSQRRLACAVDLLFVKTFWP